MWGTMNTHLNHWKLRYNPKIGVLWILLLFPGIIFTFHVSFRACNARLPVFPIFYSLSLSSSLLAHQTHIASNARICTKNPKKQSNLPPFWKTNNIFPYDCIFNDVPLWFVKINGALLTQILTLPPLRYSNSSSSHHTWLRSEWQFQQRHGIGRRKVVNPAVSGAGVVWLFFQRLPGSRIILLPSLKLTVWNLKMNGWKIQFYFWDGIFSGANC